MFVFDFGPDGRVCISIEVRYRIGQDYNLMRSLYRQQELVYIVCDERDAILRRTKYSAGHDVYLYRMVADEDEIRQFFAEYSERINFDRLSSLVSRLDRQLYDQYLHATEEEHGVGLATVVQRQSGPDAL